MDSRRELIIKHLVALLDGSVVPDGLVAGAVMPPGLSVHRYRGIPLETDDLPAVVVYPINEPAQRVGGLEGPIYQEELLVRLEHRVDADGESPDAALDPLINWCVQVIGADNRLGGLALHTQKKGTTWDPKAGAVRETLGAAATDWAIGHQTLKHNPEAKS